MEIRIVEVLLWCYQTGNLQIGEVQCFHKFHIQKTGTVMYALALIDRNTFLKIPLESCTTWCSIQT